MHTFKNGLDDGRTQRIDADSHDAALAGAQHFLENAGPRTNAPGAAAEGFLDTAGFGLRDEIRGLAKASGLPEWAGGGWRAIPGAIELGIEKLRGEKNLSGLITGDTRDPVQRAYEEERDFTRRIQKQSQEEHPTAYTAGQVGGGVASALTMPGFRAAEGAGMLGRAGAAAKTGALYGGAYGFGSGEGGLDSLSEGLIGGATGGVVGGAASPVVDVASHVAGVGLAKAGEIYQWLRSEANPRFVNEEATRRVAGAIGGGIRAGQAPLTQADVDMARRAGGPLVAGGLR